MFFAHTKSIRFKVQLGTSLKPSGTYSAGPTKSRTSREMQAVLVTSAQKAATSQNVLNFLTDMLLSSDRVAGLPRPQILSFHPQLLRQLLHQAPSIADVPDKPRMEKEP